MLSIKKRNRYLFTDITPNVILTDLTYLMNPNKGYTTINFDLTNATANLRIYGLTPGLKHFFKLYMNTENEVVTGLSEGRMEIDGALHYFSNDTQIIETSLTPSTNYIDILIDGLTSSGAMGYLYGFINKLTLTTNMWHELDVDETQIKITNAIKQTGDLSKISTMFSKEFDIHLNKQNLDALEVTPDLLHNLNNNISTYDLMFSISNTNMRGQLSIIKSSLNNDVTTLQVSIISDLSNFISEIEDNRLINTLMPSVRYNIANVKTNQYSQTHDISNEQFAFILHDWGQNITERYLHEYYKDKAINKTNVINKLRYDDDDSRSVANINETYQGLTTNSKANFINNFVPAIFAKKLFKDIHTQAGFIADGDFIDSQAFNELLILPSNFEHSIDNDSNYFEMANPTYNQVLILSENTQKNQLLYGSDVSANDTLSGMSARAQLFGMVDTYQAKEGMYTNIDYEIIYDVYQSNGTGTYSFNYDVELYIEYANMTSSGNRELLNYIDKGQFNYSGDRKEFIVSGTLEDVYIPSGYGYRDLQVRMVAKNYNNGVGREITYEITKFSINNNGLIQSKYAPTSLIDLSTLLPDISEKEFVKNIITAFNLYPVFKNNIITYYTYDEYFALGEIVKFTDIVSVEKQEIILPKSYVASTYNFNQTQDVRGEIELINKTEALFYGDYKTNSVYENDIIQDFTLDFGIPIRQSIRRLGSSIYWTFGRNSRQNLSQTRSTWSGRNGKDNYYNDYEISDLFILGSLHRKNYPAIYMVDEYLQEGTGTEVLVHLDTALPDGLSFEELYDEYYKKQIEIIKHTGSLKLYVEARIDEAVFSKCQLNNVFKINNNYYYLESIKDWSTKGLSKLIFIKLRKNPLYNSGS